ncbi:MAG: hypothetical protein NC821_06390 [Candidatus Omnitrophica bacterium]|nr:hypothetical protein [Candidatus Omnitrophota bacterium]
MKKDNYQKIVLSILLAIFAVSLLSLVIRIRARMQRYKSTVKKVTPISISKISPAREDLEKIFSQMKIKRDPFILGGPEKEEEKTQDNSSPFQLTAIVWDRISPLAIINNEVVSKGDEISGATIIDIEINKVRLIKDGETIILELYPEQL